MSYRNPIQVAENEKASHFIKFKPSLEYGFRQGSLIKRERTSDFRNWSPMKLSDASSMFHNFYGLETNIFLRQRDKVYGSGDTDGTFPEANFATNLNYQSPFPKPDERYNGSNVIQTNFAPRQDVTYLRGDAILYSVTNQMNKFYSNDNFEESNFLGFGQFLFQSTLSGRSSQYGGLVDHYVAIATWEIPQDQLAIGRYRVYVDGEYVIVNAFDGSYQEYLIELEKQLSGDTRMIPEIKGSLTYSSFTLSDNNGQNIPFRKTEAKVERIDKQAIYAEDDNGNLYIKDVEDLEPPITSNQVNEGGLFFKYGTSANEDIGNLQPNNYLI